MVSFIGAFASIGVDDVPLGLLPCELMLSSSPAANGGPATAVSGVYRQSPGAAKLPANR